MGRIPATTSAEVRHHYDVEVELAERLGSTSKEERLAGLYVSIYAERLERIQDHPLMLRSLDEVARERATIPQLRLLETYLAPDVVFMEIGPGDCALALAVAERVSEVYAVDVTDGLLHDPRRPDNFRFVSTNGVRDSAPAREGRSRIQLPGARAPASRGRPRPLKGGSHCTPTGRAIHLHHTEPAVGPMGHLAEVRQCRKGTAPQGVHAFRAGGPVARLRLRRQLLRESSRASLSAEDPGGTDPGSRARTRTRPGSGGPVRRYGPRYREDPRDEARLVFERAPRAPASAPEARRRSCAHLTRTRIRSSL